MLTMHGVMNVVCMLGMPAIQCKQCITDTVTLAVLRLVGGSGACAHCHLNIISLLLCLCRHFPQYSVGTKQCFG